jgi:hypothetical protein
MTEIETYRPANIEFDVANSSIVPDNFGQFETENEAFDFIHKHLTAINQKISVNRFMDNFEKKELRGHYADILENKLPIIERDLMIAEQAFNEAKVNLTNVKEMYNATVNECKMLASTVKKGVKEMNLDDQYTFRVPFDGKYFFITFIDKQVKLCKISDIPSFEKQDLYNAMAVNGDYFKSIKQE